MEDFERNLKSSKIIESFKAVEKSTRQRFSSNGFWFKAFPAILIVIGLIFAIVALCIGARDSQAYGTHSFVVNPPNNSKYVYDGFSGINHQVWVLRAAQGATPDSFREGDPPVQTIRFNLPDANNMLEGSTIVVKNASVRVPTGNDENTTASVPIEVWYNGDLKDTILPVPNPFPYETYVVSSLGLVDNKIWYKEAFTI